MSIKKGLSPDDYISLANDGFSQSEVARLLGVTVQTVHKMAKRHNINFPMGYVKKEKRDALVGQADYEA